MVAVSDPQLNKVHILLISPDGAVRQETDGLVDRRTFDFVFSMDWATHSDTLFIGVRGGTCMWRFQEAGTFQNFFYPHERGFDVDIVSVAPDGRLFVTLSRDEDAVYVWDAIVGTSTKLICTMYVFRRCHRNYLRRVL